MKTIIAVTFFGILTYTSAETIQYGKGSCQTVKGMKNFDAAQFFSGPWSLTHATPSARVTKSTICRDYALSTGNDGKLFGTYGYYENGASGNYYDIHCSGSKSTTKEDLYGFDCELTNARGEKTHTHIDAYFIATDYTNYGLIYRCVKSDTQFEDNVFVIYRNKNPSDDKVKEILSPYGLDLGKFISRKEATCTTK
uniref:Pc58, similar to Td11,triatin-like n=1 Tax=Panstrongylus chinai TaxID=156444 RepID=A0A286T605_9HEMI|nr:Pc58, similar to Td11,triatin-like [Panstrongylus chinai]